MLFKCIFLYPIYLVLIQKILFTCHNPTMIYITINKSHLEGGGGAKPNINHNIGVCYPFLLLASTGILQEIILNIIHIQVKVGISYSLHSPRYRARPGPHPMRRILDCDGPKRGQLAPNGDGQ